MSDALSPRLAAIVDALPLAPHLRVLEIGCGPGAAARAVAARLTTGHVLAVDRSAKAVVQARARSAALIVEGRLEVRQVAAEDLVLEPGEALFDLAFAVRVGALDGRHPAAGRVALRRIAAALVPGGRLYVDGGNPLREIPLPHRAPAESTAGGAGTFATAPSTRPEEPCPRPSPPSSRSSR